MIARVVLAALARVASGAQFVHGDGQCLVCLDAQCAKAHGSCHEMLHDAFHRLYLFQWDWIGSFLPAEEVANEDGTFLLIHHCSPFLELLIAAQPCGQLQVGNRFRIPGMQDSIPAPRELTLVLQKAMILGSFMHADGIAGNLFQSDATDGAGFSAEIASQQILAQSDALEYLGTTIGANGGDAHFRHDLLQTLIHCLDVVLLGCGVFFLNLSFLHQIVEHGECHIRTQS